MITPLTPDKARSDAPWKAWRASIGDTMESVLESILAETSRETLARPLLDELLGFIRRPGKRVRPLLLLHSYRTFSGKEPNADTLQVAAALELLHVFILAHDDVIDRSDTRSGMPTLHRSIEGRLGVHHGRDRVARALAIVLGDILFAAAQRAILKTSFSADVRVQALDAMLSYMADTGLGECDDVLFGVWDIGRIQSSDVEHMYWLKTSRYSIECPLVLGAILAGRDASTLDPLREISRPLGLAFQIRNDLKAFREFEISDAEIPDDFLEGKKTLLMTTAYEQLGETDRRLLQLSLGQRPVTDAALSTIKELVVKSRAVSLLETRVTNLADSASSLLDAAPWPENERTSLCYAIHYLNAVLECRPRTGEAAA